MWRLLPASLLLLLAWPSPADAEEATSEAEGAHFRVVVHFEGEATARSALSQVEGLWDLAAELYGLPKGPRRQKLAVHLYRDAADYRIADEKLTGGQFQRNLAFAHYGSKSAHVALQPDLSDAALASLGLPFLTRSMLLHESAHLVRYEAMPTFRSHPSWFGDGLAMWLKHRLLSPASPERTPLGSTPVVRVQRLLQEGRLPSVERILADDTDEVPFYGRYALRYLFVRYLLEAHAKAMRTFLRKVRRLGGGGGLKQEMADLLRRSLGAGKAGALDEGFRTWLQRLQPTWEEVYRSLSGADGEWVQIAFPDKNAVAWRAAAVGRPAYALSAVVEILPNAAHQVNLLLDRADEGFLVVALSAGFGVTLFEYEAKENRWNRRASASHPSVQVGKPFHVEVRVAGGAVAVAVDGEALLRTPFPQRRLTGACGLGALAGSAGVYRDLKLP